jgi:hypothetical protein
MGDQVITYEKKPVKEMQQRKKNGAWQHRN